MRCLVAGSLIALMVAGCSIDRGGPATDGTDAAGGCPITLPSAGFVPSDDRAPTLPGHVWFGADALFTQLPVDGDYGPRKSVWWSSAFPGGPHEEEPPIAVTWERLDGTALHVGGRATGGYTPEDGWFMIAGIDPEGPGCWQVTAAYKGATLSYVYER